MLEYTFGVLAGAGSEDIGVQQERLLSPQNTSTINVQKFRDPEMGYAQLHTEVSHRKRCRSMLAGARDTA